MKDAEYYMRHYGHLSDVEFVKVVLADAIKEIKKELNKAGFVEVPLEHKN